MKRCFVVSILCFIMLAGCTAKIHVFEGFSDAEIVWRGYEKATYDLLVDGERSSEYESVIEKIIEVGKEIYKIDTVIRSKDGLGMTGAIVDSNLDPISSYNRHVFYGENSDRRLEVLGNYEEGELNINTIVNDKERTTSLTIPDNIVDNEYVLMLVRNLPFKKGYRKKLNIAVIGTTQVAPYEISVDAIETIEVPYGKFECYKVVWKYIGRGRVPNIYAWYSTGKDKKMVKYKNQNIEFHLKSYEIEKNEN